MGSHMSGIPIPTNRLTFGECERLGISIAPDRVRQMIDEAEQEAHQEGYAEGWNDCLERDAADELAEARNDVLDIVEKVLGKPAAELVERELDD